MAQQLRQRNDSPSENLPASSPATLLSEPSGVASPVLRVILERASAGSRPLARQDDHLVCLAIEGGGMRGAVSAGMCVMLEAMGLVSAFDRIYGVSAGALNACATAAGQAALAATLYEDAAIRGVINRMRPLVRRPVVNFELLFGEVIGERKPLSFEGLAAVQLDKRAEPARVDEAHLRKIDDNRRGSLPLRLRQLSTKIADTADRAHLQER